MKIEKITENGNGKGGKTELGAVEKYIFDREDGEIRLKSIHSMEADNQCTIELSELSGYGSKAGTSNGLAISLNRVFIVGKLPLKAMSRKDKVVIKKLARFKADEFGKADQREMGTNHIEKVKKELEIVKAEMKAES